MKYENYYLGKDKTTEVIDVIESYNLNFSLGCALKYILRAGLKTQDNKADLTKAINYLNRELLTSDFKYINPVGLSYTFVIENWQVPDGNIKNALYNLFMFCQMDCTHRVTRKEALLDKTVDWLEKELA